MKAPCNGCERRTPGCHGACPDYKSWRLEYDRMKAGKREEAPELSRSMKRLMWRRMLRR